MLSKENLQKFTKLAQTDIENVAREYCQHLFLSFLYQQKESEKLLFKGGTALRIIYKSPRFSEDLDFTGVNITQKTVEEILTNTLAAIEKTGIKVDIEEGKPTTGGYLGIAYFSLYDLRIKVKIEVSLRRGKELNGVRTLIQSDYLPPYTVVHLPIENMAAEKFKALVERSKPRDFYDFFFLLTGNYPFIKTKANLETVLKLIEKTQIDFRAELKKLLPVSHHLILKDFKENLKKEIEKVKGL